MEASGTPGTKPGSQELEAAIARLESGITDMQGRVNGDLAELRRELDALNAQHDEIDLTPFVARIDAIIETVTSIDVVISSGTGADQPPEPDPGTPGTPPVDPVGDTPGQPPVDEAPADPAPVEEPPADDASNGPGGDEEGTVGGDATPEGASPGIVEGDQPQQPPAPDEEWPEGQG